VKRLLLIVTLLTLPACHLSLPRLPDGSLNVPVLLQWAQDGINADCAFAPTSAVCNLGTDAIATARTKAPADVKRSLVDAETRFPVIAPYVDWLIRLL
jgi:hypothetical protein